MEPEGQAGKEVEPGRFYFGAALPFLVLVEAIRPDDAHLEPHVDVRPVGTGLGYRLIKSQRQEPAVLGAPLLVREVPLEASASTQDLALPATAYSLFLTEYPKTNLDVTNQIRFGLSEPGRFLLNLNASVRRELWHDFFIAGSFYDSYDNRPPASSALKNDVGVKLTFGWSF